MDGFADNSRTSAKSNNLSRQEFPMHAARPCFQRILKAIVLVASLGWLAGAHAQAPADPLPSWNDGAVKKSITDFIPRVTTAGSADFVPLDQRIATFDNDGTLWAEQPMYFQIIVCASIGSRRWPPRTRTGKRSSRSRPRSKTTARRWRRWASPDFCRFWRPPIPA